MCQDCQPELQLYQCIDGYNAFTITTAAFTMPAEGAGVTIQVSNAGQYTGKWASPGQLIFISSNLLVSGYFAVVSSTNTSINVINVENTTTQAYTQNAAPGTIFPIGCKVSPAGIQGPVGTSGSAGATGPTGPTGLSGNNGVAVIDSQWFNIQDRYNLTGGTSSYGLFGNGSGSNVISTVDSTLWMDTNKDELLYTAIIITNDSTANIKTDIGVAINNTNVLGGAIYLCAYGVTNGQLDIPTSQQAAYRIEGKITRISSTTFRAESHCFLTTETIGRSLSGHYNGPAQSPNGTFIDFTTQNISGLDFSNDTYLMPVIATQSSINSYSLIHFSVWGGKKA
jgi:hypothetical protein